MLLKECLQMYKKKEKLNMSANLSAFFYLISGILFILALRGLSSPETSRQGNYFGIGGMIIAMISYFLICWKFWDRIYLCIDIFSNWWSHWRFHSI